MAYSNDFRKSNSAFMKDKESANSLTTETGSIIPKKKWTIPIKSSFINGRGDVLPVGATISPPRIQFPTSNNSNLGASNNYTSTSSNPETGEQRYVKTASGGRSSSFGKDSSSIQSHINFPSPYGVTQRVIVKRSSSGLLSTGIKKETVENQKLEISSRADTTKEPLARRDLPPPSPPPPSPLPPLIISLSAPTSTLNSPRSPIFPSKPTSVPAQPLSPLLSSSPTPRQDAFAQDSTLAAPFVLSLPNSPRTSSRAVDSPIESDNHASSSSTTSETYYDRRPASLAWDQIGTSSSSHHSVPSSSTPSALSKATDPFGDYLPSRIRESSNRSQSPLSIGASMLNRPRPNTPDPYSPSHSVHSSVDTHGYSTSRSSHVLQKSTGSSKNGDPSEFGSSNEPRTEVPSTSVLDRPRPKTPDTSSYLDQIPSFRSNYPESRRRMASSDTGHQSVRSWTTITSGSSNASPSLLSLDLGIRETNETVFDLDSLLRVGRTDSPLKQEITHPQELDKKVPPPLDLSRRRGIEKGNQVSKWRDSVISDDDGSEEGDRTPLAIEFSPIEHSTPTRSSSLTGFDTTLRPAENFPPSPASSAFLTASSAHLSNPNSPSKSSPTRSPTQEFFPTATSINSIASSSSYYYASLPPPSPIQGIAEEESSQEKSLPPTPASSSPTLYLADLPTASPRRLSNSILRKGFSKIINNIPSPTPLTGFQVLSGRKGSANSPVITRPREASLSSSKSGSSEQHSETSSAGKRFADRFARRASGEESRGKNVARSDGRRVSIDPAPAESSPKSISSSRRSFDRFAESMDVSQSSNHNRSASADNLLSLATVKLLNLGNNIPVSVTNSATSIDSPRSFSSADQSPEKPIQIATALRINRSNQSSPPASASAIQALEYPGRSTAVPKLVKRDSIGDENSRGVVTSSPGWRKRVKVPDSGVGSDGSLSTAWIEVEDAAILYTKAVESDTPERGAILANLLLPFLRKEEEKKRLGVDAGTAKRQRQVLFMWLTTLTRELKDLQPMHRGACLESLAGIAESRFMSIHALSLDREDELRYRTSIVQILECAVDKLNDKAVYANTLVFSGRVFALAFFRIEGVALKLLLALPPVKRQFVKRILAEANVDEKNLPPVDSSIFPSHLSSLCLTDLRAYNALLMPIAPKPVVEDDHFLVREGEIEVEMSGNWLIRWTASDSDLPFAFYRAYHRQLAAYIVTPSLRIFVDGTEPPLSPSEVICTPGFLFLAASLLDKCDALVHRNLRSVTSIGPGGGNSFNSNDSANLAVGQKPKVLELANRRLVSTMLDIVGGPPASENDIDIPPDTAIRRHAFSGILQLWIRASVKKTSMWDTRSVFILLDLIEGLIYTLSYPAPSQRFDEVVIIPQPIESCLNMFDITFILSFVKTILTQADNTVAIMRTIAFVYAHFEIFTLRPEDRNELCQNIILDEKLFSRLYLHWNAGVRGYFIRLLVWRLARLGIVAAENQVELGPKATIGAVRPDIVALFELMNVRLEVIRRRHDELEPIDDSTDDIYQPKRSTICSTGGVNNAPYVVNELINRLDEEDEESYEEKEVVRTSSVSSSRNGGLKQIVTVARVVSWIKEGLGKARNSSKSKAGLRNARIDPFLVDIEDEPPIPDRLPMSDATPEWDYSPLTLTNSDPVRKERPKSTSLFSFEFESGLPPLPPLPFQDTQASPVLSSATSTASFMSSTSTADTSFPSSASTRTIDGLPQRPLSGVSNRVSRRFSKRISILPPAALDVLKENGEPVPLIPLQYQKLVSSGYDQGLHPYAIRGLRDYEDALSEWEDWILRLQEDEDEGKLLNKGFVDLVPRLSVSWPANIFED